MSETLTVPTNPVTEIEPVTPQEWVSIDSDLMEDTPEEIRAREESIHNANALASLVTKEDLLDAGLLQAETADADWQTIQSSLAHSLWHYSNEITEDTIASIFLNAAKASTAMNDGKVDVDLAVGLMNSTRNNTGVAELLPDFVQRWKSISDELPAEKWQETEIDPKWLMRQTLYAFSGVGSSERDALRFDDKAEIYGAYGAMLSQLQSIVALGEMAEHPKTTKSMMIHLYNGADRHTQMNQARAYSAMVEGATRGISDDKLERFGNAANVYAKAHGLDEYRTQALIDKVLPRLEGDDAVSEILNYTGNNVGMNGNFGILDYTVHSLVSKPSPATVNELLMAMKDVPALNIGTLEQNRKDAVVLIDSFGALRDLIHDQRPGVHELLTAMSAYYDTYKSGGNVDAARAGVEAAIERCAGQGGVGNMSHTLNLELYDDVSSRRNPEAEPNIDVIKRLVENTRPVQVEAPQVLEQWLADGLKTYEADKSPERLMALAQVIRRKLEDSYAHPEQAGFEPSLMQAITWVDAELSRGLTGLREGHSQEQIMQSPFFLEALQFSQATMDAEYTPEAFAELKQKLKDSSLPVLDRKKAYLGASMLAANKRARYYASIGRDDWKEAVWSGNIAHEVTMLGQVA